MDGHVYTTAVLNLFAAGTQSRVAFTYKNTRTLQYQNFNEIIINKHKWAIFY